MVFGVILGTGVGGGIVVDGRVLTGPTRSPANGAITRCRGRATTNDPARPAIAASKAASKPFSPVRASSAMHLRETGEPVARKTSWRVPAHGDAACEASLQRYEHRLARSLAHVINILDPDVIVLGGGMSNIERLYANVPALWGRWVFSDRVDTRLVKHRHGDSSGVRGAAWLGGSA